MHQYLRRSGAVTLLAGGAALMSSACARDDSSIFIRGCMTVTRTDCSVQVTATPTLDLEGAIDAAYAGQYVCTMLVENQLVPRGNPNTLKTETSGVQLYDAEVQVLDPTQGMAAISQYSVPVAGFLDPGMSGQPGVGASEVVMVDAATIQGEAATVGASGKVQQVVSSVVLRGRTLGGLEVHTQEFLYPISIYVGSSCTQPSGMPCVSAMGSTAMADCRLGINEPAGTSCQNIASTVGVCKALECPLLAGTGKSDLLNAHCPTHIPPDTSCCNP